MRWTLFALLCSAVVATLLLPAPPAARAGTLRVEAESYVDSHNIVPDDLHVVDGILYGLDYDGEWTRYALPALEPGRYSIVLKCWGALGTPYKLHLTLDNPPRSPQMIELSFTGRGACGT